MRAVGLRSDGPACVLDFVSSDQGRSREAALLVVGEGRRERDRRGAVDVEGVSFLRRGRRAAAPDDFPGGVEQRHHEPVHAHAPVVRPVPYGDLLDRGFGRQLHFPPRRILLRAVCDGVLGIDAVGVTVDRAAGGGGLILAAQLRRPSLGHVGSFAEDFDLGQLQEALLARDFDADVFRGEGRGSGGRQDLRTEGGDDEVAAGGKGLQPQRGQLPGVQGQVDGLGVGVRASFEGDGAIGGDVGLTLLAGGRPRGYR